MARDGSAIAYTAEEARALADYFEARDDFYEAWEKLNVWLSGIDRDRAWPILSALDANFGAYEIMVQSLIHARLCRILPQLADVLTLACWPDLMPTPEFLDPTGKPIPVSNVANPYRS